ncbi:mediator complex subunit [Staphylotrichum longicolle]|uniref:Mediator of RNA polymerase II transcription subunit 14 n=1 Tax=Staphylotrichum longicolle TaxID=669026 RepID=A0AAD4F4T2_9PEZI|nr:mediator complex subunit [Staphylotrichum longicolle]
MDSSMHIDAHTDKGKASIINGVKEENVPVKPEALPDGLGTNHEAAIVGDYSSLQALQAAKTEDLPDELQHITTDIMPLSQLLSRLAQFSHAKLQQLILDLASKPLPELNGSGKGNSMGGGVNGSLINGANGGAKSGVNGPSPALEDTSPESLEKKTMILNFIQDLHSRWVKALVIAEWARNADDVSKLIDIRSHLAEKLELYTKAFWDMVNVKHEMSFAKVPSPDLKTALEVLSTGAVHWMPDFGYLPKPPLTAEEEQDWLHEIEMHLHMRLQLHEYERIPQPWKQYEIANGRVTFTVPGEFEVDLTISDEEFDSQFWFLDYRPIFSPAPAELSEGARKFIEARVNGILETEGLPGCYNYLHGLTLTTKVGEFARQAVELSQTGLWTETLKVERLDRVLSIQYWAHSRRPPSWILIGVHSGKASEGVHDLGSPSHLMLQWFRDGKEVKNADIPFNVDTISVEQLLMTVISKHIEHLFSSIFNTLSKKPRYAQKQGKLALRIAEEKAVESSLTMELLGDKTAVLRIGPWLGDFYFLDPSPAQGSWKARFNSLGNPTEDAPVLLERLRWFFVMDYLKVQVPSTWTVLSAPRAPLDEVKSMVYSGSPSSREGFQAVWLRHVSWDSQWFLVMTMSLGGDNFCPPQKQAGPAPGKYINAFTRIEPSTPDLHLSESFFENLAKYGTSIMLQIKALRNLHQQRVAHASQRPTDRDSCDASSLDRLPTLHVRSSDILGPRSDSDKPARLSWAQEFISIDWKGLAPVPASEFNDHLASAESLQRRPVPLRVMVEAKVAVTNRAKFEFLENRVDRDVLYDSRVGQFTLRFRPEANESVIPMLQARMQALDRLVNFVDALGRAGKHIVPESITLRKIIFSYGDSSPAAQPNQQLPAASQGAQRVWKVRLDLAREQGVDVILEAGNPHLRIIDYLRAAANSSKFKQIPAWLVFTLPLFRGLEQLQDSWNTVLAKEQGACYIFHKSLDWVTLRFALAGAKGRRVHLDIRPRDKAGNLTWHIYRPATDANVNNENDEFNRVLKQRVWSTSGSGFKGLMNGAVANWDDGIESLLALISTSIQPATAAAQQQQPQHQQTMLQQQGLPAGRFPHQLQQPQQAYQQQQARLQQQQQHMHPGQGQAGPTARGDGQEQQQRARGDPRLAPGTPAPVRGGAGRKSGRAGFHGMAWLQAQGGAVMMTFAQ